MASVSDLLFWSTVSFLLVHELDAIRRREWQFFFAPVSVSDETAYRAFTALHLPLFVGILWFLDSVTFRLGLDAFAIVHGVVHLLLRNHPLVAFDNWFSRLWIFGASVLGAAHLVLIL